MGLSAFNRMRKRQDVREVRQTFEQGTRRDIRDLTESQLIEYAEENGIDISSADTKEKAIKIIEKSMK